MVSFNSIYFAIELPCLNHQSVLQLVPEDTIRTEERIQCVNHVLRTQLGVQKALQSAIALVGTTGQMKKALKFHAQVRLVSSSVVFS